MPSTLMSLGRMVDLAIGCPDVGSVNFNVLHSLLRAMVNHLGVVDVEAMVPDDEAEEQINDGLLMRVHADQDSTTKSKTGGMRRKDVLEGREGRGKQDGEKSGRMNGEGEEGGREEGLEGGREGEGGIKGGGGREGGEGGRGGGGREGGGEERREMDSTNAVRVAELEKKMEKLEELWKELNSFPSNGELLEHMRRGTRGTAEEEDEEERKEDGEGQRTRTKRRPVSEMWMSLQLSKKVDANTEGVGKSLSLIEDLFHEVESLRMRGSGIDRTNETLEEKWNEESGRETNSSLPIDQLNGTQAADNKSSQPQNINQSEIKEKERLASGKGQLLHGKGRTVEELERLVERVGERLTEEMEATKMRLDQIEANVSEKADRTELIGLGEEMSEKMTNLICDIDKLRRSQKETLDAVNQMEQMVNQLQDLVNQFQEAVNHLTEATQRLSDESINHQNHLETLFCSCKDLNDKKADKDFVQNEVAIKANKDHLDEKVSCRNFDSTCEEMNSTINDLINKLMGHEDDWKKTTLHLNNAVEGKLDRLEFGPFRDELEKQLRLIARRMAQSADGGGVDGKGELTDDEAAGFRKQLLQTFHCISCNKPLDMKSAPQRSIPSLPSIPRLPETHSIRPYTVFELSQIRQLAHSHGNSHHHQQQHQSASQIQDLLDLCNKPRFCGGSHTLTYPHRRITKLSLSSHLNPAPPPVPPSDNNPPHQPASSKGGGGRRGRGRGGGGGRREGGGGRRENEEEGGRGEDGGGEGRGEEGGGGSMSSKLLPNVVHANSEHKSDHLMMTMRRSCTEEEEDDQQQQELTTSRSRSSKRERSKVNAIGAAMEEAEEEREEAETDRRSILSSSISGLENEVITDRRLERETPPPPQPPPPPPLLPLPIVVSASTEDALHGSQRSMPEGNDRNHAEQMEKKDVE